MSGALSVYRDMFDTHAIEHVDDIDGGGAPVGHALWAMLPALIVSVLTLSAAPLIVVTGIVLLWTTSGALFCWRLHRHHRVVAGLPVWPLARYFVPPLWRGLLVTGAWVGGQALYRYLH